MKFPNLAAGVVTVGMLLTTAANAGPVYVGSWEVDQGPSYFTVPPAYTGQEAAALLFGGSPSDYVISTVDDNPADINDMAWVSTYDSAEAACLPTPYTFPCGSIVADNSVVSTGGFYENGGDQSAYVDDWAVGSQYTNYAFEVTPAPEPITLSLFGAGLAGAAALRRRKQAKQS